MQPEVAAMLHASTRSWGKPANGRLLFLQVSFVFLLMRSLGLEAATAEEVFFKKNNFYCSAKGRKQIKQMKLLLVFELRRIMNREWKAVCFLFFFTVR